MKRSVFFRADGNDKIGRGHISRCVAVADQCKTQAHFLLFIVRW